MSKYNLFSPNPDNQTLADSLYKSKKKTKKRKIWILPFFIKRMPQNKQILTLRICNIWFKKLVNWEISNKYREVKPFWTSRLFEADWNPKNFSEIHIKKLIPTRLSSCNLRFLRYSRTRAPRVKTLLQNQTRKTQRNKKFWKINHY